MHDIFYGQGLFHYSRLVYDTMVSVKGKNYRTLDSSKSQHSCNHLIFDINCLHLNNVPIK